MLSSRFARVGLLLICALLLINTSWLLRPPPAAANQFAAPSDLPLLNDFEAGLPTGWFQYNGNGAGITPALQVVDAQAALALPGQLGANTVLSATFDLPSGSYAGFGDLYSQPQDWSAFSGLSFWFYGHASGNAYEVEVFDNRLNGDSGAYERFDYRFVDDTSGWQQLVIPFVLFGRSAYQDAGAPDDGFNGDAMWGWLIDLAPANGSGAGALAIDNLALVNPTPFADFEPAVPAGWFQYNGGASSVTVQTPTISPTDPLALPGQISATTVLSAAFNVGDYAGFGNAYDALQDWSTSEGIGFWFFGQNTGKVYRVELQDTPDVSTEPERWNTSFSDSFSGWRYVALPFATFQFRQDYQPGPNDHQLTLDQMKAWLFDLTLATGPGALLIDDVSLYGVRQAAPVVRAGFTQSDYSAPEGTLATLTVSLNITSTLPVTLTYATAEAKAEPYRDYVPVSGTLVIAPGTLSSTIAVQLLDDTKFAPEQRRIVVNLTDPQGAVPGSFMRALLAIDDDESPDPLLIDDFTGFHPLSASAGLSLTTTELAAASPMALPGQGDYEHVLSIDYAQPSGPATRRFAQAQDWSAAAGLSFWYYGSNSGQQVTLDLHSTMAATTAALTPTEWVPVWSDEFNAPAGTPPNPNTWGFDRGDGLLEYIPGWGNSELEYYTSDPANVATDGQGNLVIRARATAPDTDLVCWYGPCAVTSARLLSKNRFNIEYGKLEARVKVPAGGAGGANAPGLWPAFWMLGSNIGTTPWPQSGEIDIMENVSRQPNLVYGTIHGPGYSGAAGFGNAFDVGAPVADAYHTFSIEWQPNLIRWYFDGALFHSATPADVAPNEWVYNHDFFMLLNLAAGGNFGGALGPDTTFPQEMLVDYVRLYQAPDTAERFSASFSDDFSGWRKITLPFSQFTRADQQPVGAPNAGLDLTQVWGYDLQWPAASSGSTAIDQVRLVATISQFSVYLPQLMR